MVVLQHAVCNSTDSPQLQHPLVSLFVDSVAIVTADLIYDIEDYKASNVA